MQVLQGMDPDRMIIILPSALIAMYLIITLQKHLCTRENKYVGLTLPIICFIASTVLAVKPLFADPADQNDGLFIFCLRMWLTFNISTIIFGFQYIRERRHMRAVAEAMAMQEATGNPNCPPDGLRDDIQEASEYEVPITEFSDSEASDSAVSENGSDSDIPASR